MTKQILTSITILSFFSIIILGFIFFLKRKDKNIDKILNITGIFLSVISIFFTSLITLVTIKEADVKISITDGRHIIQKEKVYLVKRENNKLELSRYPDYRWHIKIKNTGNKSIDKIRVKLQFENIRFENTKSKTDYILKDHVYGIGYYTSQQYQLEEWIPAEGEIFLPAIDDTEAYIIDNNKKCYLKVLVYLEEDTTKEFKYEINLINEEL